MSFSKEYSERKDEIDAYISQVQSEFFSFPETLQAAMSYSLVDGGKRLRPLLFLEAYRVFGGKMCESVIKMAIAIECIHTYSLIHDDLPCMDNDDYRRGKLTNHKVYGEANAVLAGDALLNFNYQLMLDAIILSDNKEQTAKACKIIADAAGGGGMIGGQVLDMAPNDEPMKPSKLTYIYQHKTGDLISSALVSGAIMAGATGDEIGMIKGFGDYFGVSFQIKDDLLDVEQKGDIEKNTYVNFYGFKNSLTSLGDCLDKAILNLSGLEKDTEFLKKLALKFAVRKE